MITNKKDLVPVLRNLLREHSAKTQDEICLTLKKHGYQANQVKISRLLRKLGAVKTKNEHGKVVYWLPKEPPPANLSNLINTLIIAVTANETMIVIHTSPGAASVIARTLDYLNIEDGILGTIAGDDTIFVVPKSVSNIKKVYGNIKTRLGFI